jgi:hypothetical protein
VQPGYAAEAVPEAIRACRSLPRDAERLACYDKAIAHIEAGTTADADVSPENMFGGSPAIATPLPSQPEKAPEELKQITGKVISVSLTANGLMDLKLDNDQVWRQLEAETALSIQSGDSVTISRASFGTFRLTDKRGRSARFKRVR